MLNRQLMLMAFVRSFHFFVGTVVLATSRMLVVNIFGRFVMRRIVTYFGNGHFDFVQIGFRVVKFHLDHLGLLVPIGLLNAVNCFCGFFDALFAHSAISFYFKLFGFFCCKNRERSQNEQYY